MCGWPGNIRQEQYDRDLAPISITFFTQRLVVEGGGAIPTEVPRVGVDIDRHAARALTARALERPHLRRPDGAFTNW